MYILLKTNIYIISFSFSIARALMLRFTTAKHLEQLCFFWKDLCCGIKLWEKKREKKTNKYRTMHKAKLNFSEVEGLENIF